VKAFEKLDDLRRDGVLALGEELVEAVSMLLCTLSQTPFLFVTFCSVNSARFNGAPRFLILAASS
jgi:hypothetical protein